MYVILLTRDAEQNDKSYYFLVFCHFVMLEIQDLVLCFSYIVIQICFYASLISKKHFAGDGCTPTLLDHV